MNIVKIVDSTIDNEYLQERPNFRYKKVNILTGGNATGKTSLGKMLMLFANYCKDENYRRFLDVINDKTRRASLAVDFVTREDILYRFILSIMPEMNEADSEDNVEVKVSSTDIGLKDNYETCARRLDEGRGKPVSIDKVYTRGWHFSYPEDMLKNKSYYSIENNPKYLKILERMILLLKKLSR